MPLSWFPAIGNSNATIYNRGKLTFQLPLFFLLHLKVGKITMVDEEFNFRCLYVDEESKHQRRDGVDEQRSSGADRQREEEK